MVAEITAASRPSFALQNPVHVSLMDSRNRLRSLLGALSKFWRERLLPSLAALDMIVLQAIAKRFIDKEMRCDRSPWSRPFALMGIWLSRGLCHCVSPRAIRRCNCVGCSCGCRRRGFASRRPPPELFVQFVQTISNDMIFVPIDRRAANHVLGSWDYHLVDACLVIQVHLRRP